MQHIEPRGDAPERGATGLVPWAIRTVVAAGFVCILATQFMAGVMAPEPGTALKVARAPATPDPETTGSIGAVRSARLDPCAAPSHGAKR